MMVVMMMMMMMINCFHRVVDLQTTGDVFLEQTYFRKPQTFLHTKKKVDTALLK